MRILATPISSLMVVETSSHLDARGAFSRLFCEQELAQCLGNRRIVQINLSRTNTVGAVRGLHWQALPFAEMKLVRCLKGKVWDVAVDLRQDSPTFLRWHAEELSAANMRMMIIPEGLAHGFQVLEQQSEMLYLHTAPYTPSAEQGLRYNDPKLEISWPLAVADLSARDASHPLIDENFSGFAA